LADVFHFGGEFGPGLWRSFRLVHKSKS
jgi:hypothetical protein